MSAPTANENAHRVLTAIDKAAILALIDLRHQAHRDNNAASTAHGGVDEELNQGLPRTRQDDSQSWLDHWDSPIELESRDLKIETSHDFVCSHGSLRMSGTRKDLRRTVQFWMRETMCFERKADGWQIVHEQRSVPFYLDGGGARAELDTSPRLRIAWAS